MYIQVYIPHIQAVLNKYNSFILVQCTKIRVAKCTKMREFSDPKISANPTIFLLLSTVWPARIMLPKKCLYPWQANFAGELGLRMNSLKTDGIVNAAVYSFLKLWGYKDKVWETVDSAGEKCKHWNCRFCRDTTCVHITEQHPIKLADYAVL